MSYYIHSIPGRLRIKSLKVKQSPKNAEEVKKVLSLIQGLGTVDINLLTGSILINYNPSVLKPEEITSLLERHGYFDSSRAITNDSYVKEKVTALGNFASRTVFGSVLEKSLEGTALSYLSVFI